MTPGSALATEHTAPARSRSRPPRAGSRELLRVLDARPIEVLGKDHRRGHQRTRQGAAAGLVGSRDAREPLRAERALVPVHLLDDRRSMEPPHPRRGPHDQEGLPDRRCRSARIPTRSPPAAFANRSTAVGCRPTSASCHREPSRARSREYPSAVEIGLVDLGAVHEETPIPDLPGLARRARPRASRSPRPRGGRRRSLPPANQESPDQPCLAGSLGAGVGEHQDVAAIDVGEPEADPAHQDPVPLAQRGHHGRRGDEERLHQEALDQTPR